ncbi:hypothetical protein B484DRAFT_285060, partial [Ochromonadaceae sp. CCMP2298]
DPDSDEGGLAADEILSDYEEGLVSAPPNLVEGVFHRDPLTQAMSDNAMEAFKDQGAALLLCLSKHKKHILQTHWLLVGLAGCELRESTKQFGFKSSDQHAYMLDAYRRWIDMYETKVPEPPHDPGMFKKPNGVTKRTWQLALMILKTAINRKAVATSAALAQANPQAASLTADSTKKYAYQPLRGDLLLKKFVGDLKKRFSNSYITIWRIVAPDWPHLKSGSTKRELLPKMLTNAKLKADVKDWFAWVALGPFGLDCPFLRALRLSDRGGPTQTAMEYEARHTAETGVLGLTGRAAARRLMRGQGRQQVTGGPVESEPQSQGIRPPSPMSQQMLLCQQEKNSLQREQMAMGRVELAANLMNQAIHYASEAVDYSESPAVQELKARRVRMLMASVEDLCPERPTQMACTGVWDSSQSGDVSAYADGSTRPSSAGTSSSSSSQQVLYGMGNMGIQGGPDIDSDLINALDNFANDPLMG